MRLTLCLLLTILLSSFIVLADITFTGDVSEDFDDNSTIYNDTNGEGDVYMLWGMTSTGWDMYAAYFHYDRSEDRLYVGIDFNGRICGDADGDGDPGNTGSILAGYGGHDIAGLGIMGNDGETVCVYFNTDLSGGYEVIAGIPEDGDTDDFTVAVCTGNANNNPSNCFGEDIASAAGSQLYMSPDADHPDFEFFIENFSLLPGFDYDPIVEDVIFKVGAYAGSWEDSYIGNDVLGSSQKTITFYAPETIPHTVPRDLYIMQGIPLFVDDGDPEVLFGDDLNNEPIGWPLWRVSRWNAGLQTYERWNEEPNWPINVGGDPPEQDPGKGFWFVQDVMDDCQLNIDGTSLEPGWVVFQSIQRPLDANRRGLTQLANPFHVDVEWGTAYLRDDPYGGPAVSIDDAVDAGYMCRYAVTWDPYSLEYITNDYDVVLEPWEGFWTEQYRDDYDYTLCFDFPVALDAPKNKILGGGVPHEIDEYGEWSFNIGVWTEGYDLTDFGNYLGISSDASDEWDQFDAPEFAPQFAPDGYFHLYFPHEEWSTNPGAYCYDFRNGPFEGEKTWDFIVRAEDFSGSLILDWDGTFKAYPEYALALLDGAGNVLIENLHEAEDYTFDINDGDELEFSLLVTGLGVEVGQPEISAPAEYTLSSAYPNPFNNTARLNFELPLASKVEISVYDVNGRLVRKMIDGDYNQGGHTVSFNADGLSSGIYFLRASADGKVFGSQKLVLMK